MEVEATQWSEARIISIVTSLTPDQSERKTGPTAFESVSLRFLTSLVQHETNSRDHFKTTSLSDFDIDGYGFQWNFILFC